MAFDERFNLNRVTRPEQRIIGSHVQLNLFASSLGNSPIHRLLILSFNVFPVFAVDATLALLSRPLAFKHIDSFF